MSFAFPQRENLLTKEDCFVVSGTARPAPAGHFRQLADQQHILPTDGAQ